MQQTMLAGAGLLGSGSLLAETATTKPNEKTAEKTFNLNYGFHQGMFEAHAGKDFLDQIKWAHDDGCVRGDLGLMALENFACHG
jgi:hydroxypyruvate isomerase